MSDRDANDILMSGGVTSAAFPEIGTTVSGRICWGPEARQQTDMDTGEPKEFPNGDPMMQIIVHLETAERDPENPDDDGVRAIYIKFNLLNAVRAAVKAAKAKGLAIGGLLTVTYTGDGEQKKKGFNPPKLYTATYQPPAAVAADTVLTGGQPAAAPAPVPAQAMDPAEAARLLAAGRAVTPSVIVPAAPPSTAPATPPPGIGVDQAVYNGMTDEQRRNLWALSGQPVGA
jgi:hypothetical protein